ncbi:MAG: glycosyltransferase family 4 protein [Candidatus Omnitrophica bacterium]|nr:glycosyltransferase family 4 protein [Candidatus Omnitrophota bacterium]
MGHSKERILICGVLPPPYFGHSMLYEMLMRSSFAEAFNIKFLNMHFWSYETNKKVTLGKLFKLVKYYAQFWGIVLTFRPQYILFNISFYKMPFLKDFLFCATGIVLGCKVIIHDHGQYVRELYDSLPGWQKSLLLWMLKHSTASIVMGERVRPAYSGLMAQEKIFVVPGTVEDTRELKAVPDRPAKKNVLYFSHLSRPKGIDVAFEIASIVLRSDREAYFTFAGPLENDGVGVLLEKLQAQYPGRVRYMGYIDSVLERTALFRGADVFLFPTLRDVFGLVLLHAMSEGVPVVASIEGTIPEIVVDGQTGFLCEKGQAQLFADKVSQIFADESLRRAMSQASRKRFEEKYSLQSYGDNMIKVFWP